MDLIIYAHPDSKTSHNAAALRFVKEKLDAAGRPFEVIDLYSDQFDPLLDSRDYAAMNRKGEQRADPLVARYQRLIQKADLLVFIYPVWWYGAPAMLKGFFDRIFTAGFAYNFKQAPQIPAAAKPVIGALCGVGACYPIFLANLPIEQRLAGKRAVVINTYGGGAEGFSLFGRAPEFSVDKAVLNFCGISPVARINWFEARGPAQVPEGIARKIIQALRL
ncbi:MAG: NAD(P)H-dependent oxidoreductase [Candidatus Micrarchaeota archaeon]